MDFGEAVDDLRSGQQVARKHWSDSYVMFQCPFFYLRTVTADDDDNIYTSTSQPWMPTVEDIMAEDWAGVVF